MEVLDKRMEKANKRMDLTVKRLVKAEERMESFDRKLQQSIKDHEEFSHAQAKLNKYFIEFIKKHPL